MALSRTGGRSVALIFNISLLAFVPGSAWPLKEDNLDFLDLETRMLHRTELAGVLTGCDT